MNSTVPIEKHVVLVGAGNAHLVFLKRWRMSPWPGVAVTLVSESAEIPYSAMVPGHVAGDYRWDEITLDLALLPLGQCAVRRGAVTGVDAASSRIEFADRPAMAYDVLSLGLGSLPAAPPGWAGANGRSRYDRSADSRGSWNFSKHRSQNRRDRFIWRSSVAERAVVSWRWRFSDGCRSRQTSG